jgi:hypothetical protein
VGQPQALERQVAPRLQQLANNAVWLGEVALQQQHPPPALPLVEGKGGARHASTHDDHVPHLQGGMKNSWQGGWGLRRAAAAVDQAAGGRQEGRHNRPMQRPCNEHRQPVLLRQSYVQAGQEMAARFKAEAAKQRRQAAAGGGRRHLLLGPWRGRRLRAQAAAPCPYPPAPALRGRRRRLHPECAPLRWLWLKRQRSQ